VQHQRGHRERLVVPAHGRRLQYLGEEPPHRLPRRILYQRVFQHVFAVIEALRLRRQRWPMRGRHRTRNQHDRGGEHGHVPGADRGPGSRRGERPRPGSGCRVPVPPRTASGGHTIDPRSDGRAHIRRTATSRATVLPHITIMNLARPLSASHRALTEITGSAWRCAWAAAAVVAPIPPVPPPAQLRTLAWRCPWSSPRGRRREMSNHAGAYPRLQLVARTAQTERRPARRTKTRCRSVDGFKTCCETPRTAGPPARSTPAE